MAPDIVVLLDSFEGLGFGQSVLWFRVWAGESYSVENKRGIPRSWNLLSGSKE